MLFHLKELIFGLGSYEKVRIDIRFLEINNILNSIELKRKEDFELLEECIFKIKELLRVKSSNLNKVIKDPKSPLTKKKVLDILDKLNKIKYTFLEEAFRIISTKSKLNEENQINTNKENLDNINNNLNNNYSNPNKNNYCEDNNNKETNFSNSNNLELEKKEDNEEIELNKIEENEMDLKKSFENIHFDYSKLDKGILEINFEKSKPNLKILSQISSVLFNKFQPAGSNIIHNYNKNNSKIILRYFNDNIKFFKKSKFEGDLNEIYSKLKNKIGGNNNNIIKNEKKIIEDNENIEKEKIESNEIENNENNRIKTENNKYLEINSKDKLKKLEKVKEGLESLLNSKERKKEISNLNFSSSKLNNQNSDDKIIIEKTEDKIQVEKKEKNLGINIIKKDENSEILKKNKKNQIQNQSKNLNENLNYNQDINKKESSNNKKEQKEDLKQTNTRIDEFGNIIEIYKDSEIQVFFERNDKFPIIYLRNIQNLNFSEMNEEQISYIMAFSKIFSSLIFQILNLAGTNIIFDNSKNVLKIVPRFENDNLNLNWKGLELNKDTLNKIRDDLISVMNLTVIENNNSGNDNIQNKEKEKIESIKIEDKENKKENEDQEIRKKAEFILKSLKRIP